MTAGAAGADAGDLQGLKQRLALSRQLQGKAQALAWARRGDARRLLPAAEFAGRLAWHSHGGCFVLPEVELALRDVVLPAAPAAASAAAGQVKGRTLHVVTRAYAVGGHTRLVKRWIELLDDDRHAIALVGQRTAADPRWLVPQRRDVPIVDLWALGLRRHEQRAAMLSELMRQAQRVVLHIHPDDAVSVAAAHRAAGADIRLLNHADHVAWLGAALPVTLLNLRPGGARLAASLRGRLLAHGDVVPLPLSLPTLPSRTQARETLGLGAGDVMLLTVAAGYKFGPVAGRSLYEPLALALQRPEVKLVAIGTGAKHPVFARLAQDFAGRVQSHEAMEDPGLFRAAADVYVDSYPFCSPTSALESALLGTPVLAFQPDFDALDILYSECPGLPRQDYGADDAGGFSARLNRLLDDPVHRQSVSQAHSLGTQVHLQQAWRPAMQAHLQRRLGGPGWQARGVGESRPGLDLVLAGLGQDPLRKPGWLEWLRALGPAGMVARLGAPRFS